MTYSEARVVPHKLNIYRNNFMQPLCIKFQIEKPLVGISIPILGSTSILNVCDIEYISRKIPAGKRN